MGRKRQGVSDNAARRTDGGSLPVSVISPQDFSDLMQACLPDEATGPVAIAVSGGADSMALCLMAADWATAQGRTLTALTVDHGLRPEARGEAHQVGKWLQARHIGHQVLAVKGDAPASNIQAWARDQRYHLMEEWCAAKGAAALLLAHHQEDQAETVLLRLVRGSGVDGLSAMAATVPPGFNDGPWRLRPLLGVPKAALVATLESHGQSWIEDPTNQDDKYARNRLRHFAPELAAIGLTPQRLADTARTLRLTKAALDAQVVQLIDASVDVSSAGFAYLDVAGFGGADEDIQMRLLGRLLAALGGKAYAPRRERLASLLQSIVTNDLGGGRTLSGCRIMPVKEQGKSVLICRETRSVAGPIALSDGVPLMWDKRFRLTVTGSPDAGMIVARLGSAGWASIRQQAEASDVPRLAGLNLPALWQGDELVYVPYLDVDLGAPELAVDIEYTALRRLSLVAGSGQGPG